MNYKKALIYLSPVFGGSVWLLNTLNREETPIKEEIVDIAPISQEVIEEQEPEVLDPRAAIKAEADAAFAKMNDYTFRLFSPCNMGTGWILDYEIPKKEGAYPTTWYIATNLHVVSRYGFSENPYNQRLSISDQKIREKRYPYRRMDHSKLSLFNDYCNYLDWYGYFDFNLGREETGEELKSDMGAVANKQMEEPKLFYAALNFMKEDQSKKVDKNNWKDFAVLEVTFKSQEIAKKVTNEFAIKYPVHTKEAINVFADSLEDRYTVEELATTEQNFYSFAYPGTGNTKEDKFKASKTWDEEKLLGDRLSNDKYNWYHEQGETKTRGLVSAKKIGRPEKWGGEEYTKIGHLYLMKNFPLGLGSSGSMYIDGQNNLLGLKAVVEKGRGAMHSWVDPIRSKGFEKNGIVTPKYDLLLGGDNQLTSYKQQVEEYKKDTFLKRRNWQHIS